MKCSLNWRQRYLLSISEELTIKEIMSLRNVGQLRATEIRKKAIKYCLQNRIEIYGIKIPTQVVLIVTDLDIEYYYKKMLLELKVKEV